MCVILASESCLNIFDLTIIFQWEDKNLKLILLKINLSLMIAFLEETSKKFTIFYFIKFLDSL